MDVSELYQIYLRHPSVQTDTRKLNKGDIYFALKGANFDGNIFVQQAFDLGAAYAVVDDATGNINEKCIQIADALTTLQDLALYHRKQFNIPFLAITGSNGKTTTKELITAVLKERFSTAATEGNLNNHIGIPLTLLKIKKDAGIAVIEMGANHQKEIEGYCRIVQPTHGIITNCGKAHIEGFGGEEGVRKGKGELYDYLRANSGTIFRNSDLNHLEQMANGIATQITYGSANAQYIGKPLMRDVFLDVAVLTANSETTIHSKLVGDYNFPNMMAAIAVGLHFGVPIDKIKSAVNSYTPDNSRSQWLQRGTNKIILDAYNANPTSMRAAIANFAASGLGNKTLWIGAMKEMGTEEQNEHKALIDFISKYDWKGVILVGKEFKDLTHPYEWYENTEVAAAAIRSKSPENDAILIKGSRGSRMELLLQMIPGA